MNILWVEHTGPGKGVILPGCSKPTFHKDEVSHSHNLVGPVEYLALHENPKLVLSLNISLSTETITLIRGKYYHPQLTTNRQLLPQ